MPFLGEIASLATAVLWSGSSIVFTEASLLIGSLLVNISRMIFAAIFLAITILIAGLSIDMSNTQYLYLAASGFIGLVFGDGFLFKAFQHIGARLSMLIMSLAPPIAALLAFIFLDELLSIWGIFGIVITIAGIATVILKREEVPTSHYSISRIGLLYAFFGAIGQGAGLIFAKLAFNEGELNSLSATFIRLMSAIVILYPLALFTGRLKEPIKKFLINKKALYLSLLGSIIGPYFGITLSLVAIAHTKVGIASTIMSTVPILMLPIVKFYYKERLSYTAILGAFLAVAGIAILFLK